jgi:hypothetical protein
MVFDAVFAELKQRYQAVLDDIDAAIDSPLTAADIERWSAGLAIPKDDLYARIALELAHGYHERQFSFTFCDAIVNDIFRMRIDTKQPGLEEPELFWNVFLAFDEGEYFHSENLDDDPEEEHTRPMIADIVAKNPR